MTKKSDEENHLVKAQTKSSSDGISDVSHKTKARGAEEHKEEAENIGESVCENRSKKITHVPVVVAKIASKEKPQAPSIRQQLASMIRVDQAGEYGAGYIYKGQIDALKSCEKRPLLEHMRDQELEHLRTFNEMIVSRRIRPTIMSPLWKVAGYTLGYVTGKMGEKAAMACTVAVEEVIDAHYQEQQQELDKIGGEATLQATIEKFRQEELEHRDIGLEHGALQMRGYEPLTKAVKAASKLAIWISKRI